MCIVRHILVAIVGKQRLMLLWLPAQSSFQVSKRLDKAGATCYGQEKNNTCWDFVCHHCHYHGHVVVVVVVVVVVAIRICAGNEPFFLVQA